ncbi:MAG: hypothetical protein M3Q79_03710 [bacterium]|nr:hypothetical protein [bacterium]
MPNNYKGIQRPVLPLCERFQNDITDIVNNNRSGTLPTAKAKKMLVELASEADIYRSGCVSPRETQAYSDIGRLARISVEDLI